MGKSKLKLHLATAIKMVKASGKTLKKLLNGTPRQQSCIIKIMNTIKKHNTSLQNVTKTVLA